MTIYIITELADANSRRAGDAIEAKTLAAAKRKASRMQMFQGTVLEIAFKNGVVVARREGGKWCDT